MMVIGIAIIYGIGFNIFFGYCGQISFGHAGFYAIGAYTAVLLHIHLGINYFLSSIVAMVFTGIVAFLLGYPFLRLREHYLAMASMAFLLIIKAITIQWRELTFGPAGVIGIEIPKIFSLELKDNSLYYLILMVTILIFFVTKNLMNSFLGRAFIAIRDNEDAAPSLGINTFFYKNIAFSLSAICTGLAGVLYAYLNLYIGPECFGLDLSILAILIVVVGGSGTDSGPVIGAVILSLLPEMIYGFEDYHLISYGLVLLFFLLFMPKGIMGLLNNHGYFLKGAK